MKPQQNTYSFFAMIGSVGKIRKHVFWFFLKAGRACLFSSLVLALCLPLPTRALSWSARVLSVTDGDTIKVERLDTGEILTIRFYGIDAPERKSKGKPSQPYSKRSWHFVRDRLLPAGTKVAVYEHGFDKYARTVAGVVSLPDGKVIQEELVREGLAWVYPKYCTDCRQWKALQEEAREEGLGLWKDTDPEPPWEWRKRHRLAEDEKKARKAQAQAGR